MKPRNKWYFGVAVLMLFGGVAGLVELYESRDLSEDYYGPLFLLLGLLWLYGAYRKPRGQTAE